MVVTEVSKCLHVHIFSFHSAENLASDTSSNKQMIAEHAEGEICCNESISTLFFWSLP